MINPVELSAASDHNVISVYLPVCAEPHLAPTPRGIDTRSGKCKVFGPVGKPKRQAYRQVLTTPGQNGKHLSGSPCVRNLIEAFAGIYQRHPHAARDVGDHAIRGPHHIHGPKDSGIYPAIVYDEAALPLSSVFCKGLAHLLFPLMICPETTSS